jgi:class 3 adenylate cyclase
VGDHPLADITGFTRLNERFEMETPIRSFRQPEAARWIARKHGGTVDKYLGDCIMATFGVPLAVENAPQAAINAAIEMHNRIHEFNREQGLVEPLDIHTGINSGRVISGDVSGPVIREFSVLGDPVNIAARLKDLAPKGQIWVGEETYRHTRSTFEFRPLDALPLKGKTQKVRAYEVVSRREHLYRELGRLHGRVSSALVGRDGSWNGSETRWAGSNRDGRRGLRGGEAGIGKSRLLQELLPERRRRRRPGWRGVPLRSGRSSATTPSPICCGMGRHRGWRGRGDCRRRLRRRLAEIFAAEAEDLVLPLSTMLISPSPQREQPLEGSRQRRHGAADHPGARAPAPPSRRAAAARSAPRRPSLGRHLFRRAAGSLLRLAARHPILFLLAYRPGRAIRSLRVLAEAMREAGIDGERSVCAARSRQRRVHASTISSQGQSSRRDADT